MRKLFLNILFIFAVFALSPRTFCLAKSLPQNCLDAVQKSIDEADAQAFERHVNITGILNDGLDAFLLEMEKPEKSALLPPMAQLMIAGFKGVQGNLTRNVVLNEIASFVRNGISSGAFAGKPRANGESGGLIAPLFANASFGKKKIGIASPETETEDGLIASFFVHDYGNGNDYPVEALFVDNDSGYCLVAIRNFPELIDQIIGEAAQ